MVITDFDVIEALDQGPYDVSNWEAEFLETLIRYGKEPRISQKQRAVLVRMAQQYLPDWMVAEWMGQERIPFSGHKEH